MGICKKKTMEDHYFNRFLDDFKTIFNYEIDCSVTYTTSRELYTKPATDATLADTRPSLTLYTKLNNTYFKQ